MNSKVIGHIAVDSGQIMVGTVEPERFFHGGPPLPSYLY